MSEYIVAALIGYFVGSIPSAYLLVKWQRRIDIRAAGTGNVGARNTFDVTGSKALAGAVLILDVLKGVAAVLLSSAVLGRAFWPAAITGLGAILGHNYSPWIGFKGGRGLATALGVALVIGWILAALWVSIWVLTYVFSKNLHISNAVACIVSPWVILLLPWSELNEALAFDVTGISMFLFSLLLCILILIRHIEPLREILRTIHQPSS